MICLNVINSVENLLELEVLIFSELGSLTCTWLLYYIYIYIYIKKRTVFNCWTIFFNFD